MKKTFFAAFIIFFFSLAAFSQEYFFYSYKEKRTLNPVSNYISVKFKNDIALSQSSSIIQQVFGSNMDSKYNVNYVYDNKEKANIVIVKIKNNVSAKSIDNIKSQLLNSSSVEYTGMCFKKNDRVLHFTTDELIVKFNRGVSAADIQNLNRLYNTTILEKVDLMEGLYLVKINNKGESGADNVFDVSNKFTITPFVEYAQPNFIRQGMLESVDKSLEYKNTHNGNIPPPVENPVPGCFPNDSMAPMMWNLRNTGNNVPNNIQGVPGCDLNIVDAWCVTTGNPNVLMGIVDTGVDTNHVDLIGNLCDRNLWWDFIDNTPHQFDQYYHGTGVAGIASAVGNNHIGTVGVAYTCKILPVRVFGPYPEGYTTDLILGKGLIWAWTRGAAVINCSWGGGIDTPLITNAIRDARHYGRNGKGTVICAGSGNDDTTAVLYPSQMHEVMSIGGLSPCNERKSKHSCDFNSLDSNTQFWGASYGDSLTMVAPCTLIGITIPGLTIPDSGWCFCGNGTSDSSPMAAAVAGLMISKNINISADSVVMIMEQTCDKVGNYSYNINKQNGTWNFEMGYGRLDTKRALDMVPAGPSQINDQVPPVIKIFPPESQVFNSPISFTALITDNDSVAQGSNMPRMYFYTLSQPNIQSVPAIGLGNNMYKFTFPFPLLHISSPVFYYIASQDYSNPPNVSTYPIGGRGYNPPGNVKPPKFMYLRNTPTRDTSFTSGNVPVKIPGQNFSTTYSTLNCNFSQPILKLTCWINIQHSYDEDITTSLISPSGTETVLEGGVGHDGQNFTFTYFDDDAPTSIDTMINHSPFTGTYKPIYKLWLINGEGLSGTWQLKVVDNANNDNGGTILGWGINVKYSVYGNDVLIPDKFALVGNYPNPFNPVTRIVFNVPYISNVKIKLYDILGRQVATLLDETRQPGFQEYVDFSSNDVTVHGGTGLASGVYFITLTGNDTFIESKKMVLVK